MKNNNRQSISLPNENGDVKKVETNIDMEDLELLKHDPTYDAIVSEMRKYDKKYEKFHQIMKHLSKSTHFYQKFVIRRLAFILYHILSMTRSLRITMNDSC